MRKLLLGAMVLGVSAMGFSQTKPAGHGWVGVWDITDPTKPGAVVTLADDSGRLEGTIVFHAMDMKANKRLAVVALSLVDPHMEGDAVAFQVRRDTEMIEMKLEPAGDGKATLVCAKCGEMAPAAMTKEK